MENPTPNKAPEILISDKAAARVLEILKSENKADHILRVGIVGGGCSGLSYKLSFDAAAGEKDRIFEHAGLKMAVDPKSYLFLKGTMLDFTDGLDGRGFVFTNPNAKSTCGCGTSFSA